jgi:hypothetical protein
MCSSSQGATTRQTHTSSDELIAKSSTTSVARRHQNTRRGVIVVAQSAASSADQPAGSDGPLSSADQDLTVDLDYAPSLGTLREVLCVLFPVLLVALLYVSTGPLHSGSWLAAAGCALLAAATASLARTIWLEQAYKVRLQS